MLISITMAIIANTNSDLKIYINDKIANSIADDFVMLDEPNSSKRLGTWAQLWPHARF